MEAAAAVFRKVHEPLTIEQVEIDQPWGREVLVRTVATGRVPQRPARRRWYRAVPARPADRARPRGCRHRRGGRRRGDDRAARRPCRRLPLRLLRQLPAMPVGTSEFVHRRPRHPARDRSAAAVAERPARPPVHRHFELCRKDAAARKLDRPDRPRIAARQGRTGRLRRADRGRRGVAQLGAPGRADGRGVRLRRGRAVDRPGRPHRRRAPDHRRRPVRDKARDGDPRRRHAFRQQRRGRPGQKRCAH